MKINKILKSPHKILFTSSISSLVTLVFAVYNAYLGFRYGDSFGVSVAVYYLCLLCARLVALFLEKKCRTVLEENGKLIRRKAYIGLSVFMFFIDFCLIAPISIMVLAPKEYLFGLIPSIVFAAYTTYNVTNAIIAYRRTKRQNNLLYSFLRELSVLNSLVSVLSLQRILIMANGGMTEEMSKLCMVTSFGIFVLIVLFSVFAMKKNIKTSD